MCFGLQDDGDGEEVTWQTYKGQLTEKQIKTRDKITKRMEKVSGFKCSGLLSFLSFGSLLPIG